MKGIHARAHRLLCMISGGKKRAQELEQVDRGARSSTITSALYFGIDLFFFFFAGGKIRSKIWKEIIIVASEKYNKMSNSSINRFCGLRLGKTFCVTNFRYLLLL